MVLLVIVAALIYLVSQIKGDTGTVRMVMAIVGLVLWVLAVAGLVTVPAFLRGSP